MLSSLLVPSIRHHKSGTEFSLVAPKMDSDASPKADVVENPVDNPVENPTILMKLEKIREQLNTISEKTERATQEENDAKVQKLFYEHLEVTAKLKKQTLLDQEATLRRVEEVSSPLEGVKY